MEHPLAYQKMKSSERKQRVNDALKNIGMPDQAGRRPSQLSGGEQQRVAVARALVVKPRILLADEPTGNLDSSNGKAIMEMLKQLHRTGATICIVTHDPRFVEMADRVIHRLDGRLCRRGRQERKPDILIHADMNPTVGLRLLPYEIVPLNSDAYHLPKNCSL